MQRQDYPSQLQHKPKLPSDHGLKIQGLDSQIKVLSFKEVLSSHKIWGWTWGEEEGGPAWEAEAIDNDITTESQPSMQLHSSFHSLGTVFNSKWKLRATGEKPAKGGQEGHLVELKHLHLANTGTSLKLTVKEKLQIRYKTTQIIYESDFYIDSGGAEGKETSYTPAVMDFICKKLLKQILIFIWILN